MAVDRNQFRRFLEELATSLDIPEGRFLEAKKRYQAVGDWLGKEGSPLEPFNPTIYTQGSFRLGTVIKPHNDADEYDIDLVFEMELDKSQVTQKQLKDMVGDRLKENETYRKMLADEEGRRCWTLNYADGAQFHMDILPAIPEDDSFKTLLERHQVPHETASQSICITDNTLANFNQIDNKWHRSNPKGYAEWFKNQMKAPYEAQLRFLAESMKTEIEDVPEHRVKTTLQRAVQILKRHRDIRFLNDKDDQPISIIISTLAAHAYNNEADLLNALTHIIENMSGYIQSREGVSWVPNPVNPLENFADKWQEHPQREVKFHRWLKQVQTDLETALTQGDFKAIGESLSSKFGDRVINEALKNSGFLAPAAIVIPEPAIPHFEIKSNPDKPWGNRD